MSRSIAHRRLPRRTNERVSDPPTEQQRRERTLRLAYVNAPSALPCRPSPRSAFDKPATDETRRPWRCFAEPLRACAVAASAIGGAVAIETERRIVEAVSALLAYVLQPFTRATVGTVTYVGVVHESAEAIEAISVARGQPTPENVAKAEHEVDEAIIALELYRVQLHTDAVTPFPIPRGATPRTVA